MRNHAIISALSLAAIALLPASPVSAEVIVITQAKAEAGNVTPGDAPGFPVTLSLPGAYRFDTNLTVRRNRAGIEVKSPYIDIDMAGFRLWGWNAAGDTRRATYGVTSAFGVSGIRNGYISGFKSDGIRLTGSSNQWVIRDMLIQNNGGHGINALASSYTRILTSSIHSNLAAGIHCGASCHIEGNSVSNNVSTGILLVSGTVLGNTLFDNGSTGITKASSDPVGFGNNTIVNNNGGANQVSGVTPLHPNVCAPIAC